MPWVVFHLVLLGLLALDLGIWRKRAGEIKLKVALLWSGFWIALSLLFNLYIYFSRGEEAALQFFAGYLIEKSLSVDNLFVFIVIFSFFKIPKKYQHKVLFYGILGALVSRICFILGGVALLEHFEWMIYLLGAFLCATAVRFFVQKEEEIQPKNSFLVKGLKKIFPVTPELHGQNFFVRQKSKLYMTPLFLALLVVESTDIIFAIDSIPAVFAVTRDPFIVYTSNICAILGLRSIHFVLESFMDRFHYLKIGLSAVLLFVGAKMLLSYYVRIPIWVTLTTIALILSISVLFSLMRGARKK